MHSRVKDFVLSEPSGRFNAAVMFSMALISLGIYVYFGVLGDSSTSYELFVAGSFALSGMAEFLPKERRRTAGVLRMTAILIALLMIAILVIDPGIIKPR